MKNTEFKKGDNVLSNSKWNNGKAGIVHAVYPYGVSVNFGDNINPSYQVFHFKPSHHMQTNINDLEIIPPLQIETDNELLATNDPELIKQGVPELTPAESTNAVKAVERETGMYWVKYEGKWTIAEFIESGDLFYFLMFGCDGMQYYDEDYDEINETRISLPVEPLEACSGDVVEAARIFCNITHGRFLDSEERYYKDYQKYDGFIAGAEWQASQQSKSLNEAVELLRIEKQHLDEIPKQVMISNQRSRLADIDAFLSQFKQ